MLSGRGIVLAAKDEGVSIGVDKKILALHCPLIRYLEHAALCGKDGTPKSEMFAAGTVVQFQLPHPIRLKDVMNFLSVGATSFVRAQRHDTEH